MRPTSGHLLGSSSGTVASWNSGSGTGTINPGGLAVSRSQIIAFGPAQSRRWPTMAAADLIVGERVSYAPDGGGSVLFVGPWPDAV